MTHHPNLTPEQRKRMKESFAAVQSIASWAKSTDIQYLFKVMPYVWIGDLFYYFGVYDDGYRLVMTSSKDLNEMMGDIK